MTKEENKVLIEEYPFLLPRNRFTDKVPEDFDYSYTEMDAMPEGWRVAFAGPMLEELKAILVKGQFLNEYRITQIKEKYGYLRWYDGGVPKSVFNEYQAWLNKYATMSERTCICCGKPAGFISMGIISPYCKQCAKENETWKFVPIDDYFKRQEED